MRIKSNRVFIVALIVVLMGTNPLWAQEPKPSRPIPVRIELSVDTAGNVAQSTGNDRINRLFQMGRYDQAADLLEMYLDKDPQNSGYLRLLTICYEETQNYGKLLVLLQRRAAASPPEFVLFRDLGRMHLQMGNPDSASFYFYRAALLPDTNEAGFRLMADGYQKLGRYAEEATLIDSLRTLTKNPRLLPDRMGEALASQKKYAAATLEYLHLLERDTLSAREGERRLISMMQYPECADTVMNIVSDNMKAKPGSLQFRYTYGQLLMEQDKFDRAYEFFCNLDSTLAASSKTKESSGNELLFFIGECNRRHRHDYAIKGCRYFMTHYPRNPMFNTVSVYMADAFAGEGRYDTALVLYQSLLDDQSRQANRPDLFLKIGMIYRDHLNDRARAAASFEQAMASFPGSIYDAQARIALADVLIKKRAFDSATVLLTGVLAHNLAEDMAENIDYTMALIKLFKGSYGEADAGFRQLITRHPRGLHVNDAIEYSLILKETGDEAPGQIDLFSSSEFYQYAGMTDSLEASLTKICRVGVRSLAPVSYLRLAQVYYGQKKYAQALEAVDSLNGQYADSYFAPYGLKLKADVLLLSPQTRDAALVMYRDLLEKNGAYPFAAEIREILRRETEGKQS